ncbi:MAG TPA: type II toxin-antitoxin system VapC family toxin [Solirubrobacterales bacterium]|jgi:predicted nucleic acid-binding protein|nr:type II toxin-antitoxin system VapC family toxin [Solirubrobacterales bacterium]
MNVVDASVLVEFLAGGEHREEAEAAIGRERWVWAPALVDAEVGNALRRQARAKKLGPRKAGAALQDFLSMRVQRIPHAALADRAWQLRENVSFYDGLYVALAEALGTPLLTLDERLTRAPGLRTEVELIAA